MNEITERILDDLSDIADLMSKYNKIIKDEITNEPEVKKTVVSTLKGLLRQLDR